MDSQMQKVEERVRRQVSSVFNLCKGSGVTESLFWGPKEGGGARVSHHIYCAQLKVKWGAIGVSMV